jgi:hypothetical protein
MLFTPPWIAAQESDRPSSNFDDIFENVSALTPEEVAAYENRASAFSKIGARFRPDLEVDTINLYFRPKPTKMAENR